MMYLNWVMKIVVVTTELFDSDPRTVLLIDSLLQSQMKIGVLQIQSLKPKYTRAFDRDHGTILKVESTSELRIYGTWTSRSVAKKNLIRRLTKQAGLFSAFSDSLKNSSFNATEAFLMNQFCLAFESLSSFLTSSEGQEISLVIAEDLQSAFAGVLLSKEFGLTVCYDAHELYADAINFFGAEVSEKFINTLRITEKEIWRRSNSIATVSSGLAQHISEHADNRTVLSVPNFSSLESQVLSTKHSESIRPKYVYFGGVAPYRNVDVLVENWPFTNGAPTLSLYMPVTEWSRKIELAAEQNQNILICNPVPASELIREMSLFDAGVIPYSYPPPYDWASPNKFGEYIAAGLPVVAHPQPFTSQLIHEYGLGAICDMTSASELHDTLEMLDSDRLAVLSQAVNKAFQSDLNWNCVSMPLIEEIEKLISVQQHFVRAARIRGGLERKNLRVLDVFIDITLELLRPLLKRIWKLSQRIGVSRLIPNQFFKRIT
jgi:glycosyltransferase involved in cell wall biosynthesis